ncbi:hypothetical protein [Sporolactobacillus terrae]|uniref:Uncharacterized protein n=1 Tax=Sporolactobacillus terrae TaxID=269673 RepID=A0A5K7WVC7_9BACL|nr:hypothetical protein [Sporolactobacillus terrae]BBN97594.1 hypothetical protein St703_02990 [Sporolactobacillus terrae]
MTKISPALKRLIARLMGIALAILVLTVLGLNMSWGIVLFAVILVVILFIKDRNGK